MKGVVCRGLNRKYYRFRGGRWYGGIATADCVGCNLRCVFCWGWQVRDNPVKAGFLCSPEEVAKKLVEIAERRGYTQVRISGNEPTLCREHLLAVLDSLEGSGLAFTLETNGILIGHDPSYARNLLKYDFIHVRVSLKGTSPREFSKLTGALPEAFELQLKALENLLDYGVSAHPAVMLSFSEHSSAERLKERLAEIDPRLVKEFEGEFGTGKTQLCHQLAATVQLPVEKGGLSAKAVYIDTEGTFSPRRVLSMAERFGIGREALEKVVVFRPLNTGELEGFVRNELSGYLEDGARLVVIDSVIALYRAQYRGMEWLARRQQAINYLLDWLKRWARIYGSVAAITNQVLTHPLPSGVALKLPAGGNIIAHASTHRFLMRKAGDAWLIECLDSPRIPRGASVQFKITEAGIEDA